MSKTITLCPECGGRVEGDACVSCALVVGHQMDHREENRYGSPYGDGQSRSSSPNTHKMHDKGIGGTLQDDLDTLQCWGPNWNQDYGQNEPIAKVRSRRWCFSEIWRIESELPGELPEAVVEDACRLFSKYHKGHNSIGWSLETWAVAAMLASSRWHEHFYPIDVLVDLGRDVDRSEMLKAYKKLTDDYNIRPPMFVSEVMSKVLSIVDIPLSRRRYTNFRQDCIAKAEVVDREVVDGSSPWSVAAGVVYMVCREYGIAGNKITQTDISNDLNMHEVSIREQYQKIEEIYSG